MGIQGLLPFLDKSSRPVNISNFKGLCAAIDAYCWLHKGAYTCAEKLARGESCDAYVHYCMKYVNMLLSHNIKPVLVFDGRHLPAKAGTEKKRRESREVNQKRGAELLRAGRADEARNFLRRCVDVTHEMALNLIRECRRRNVDCIVAPYEADAQLAYLNLKGIAQVVITEDSDLVLFGCKKVMFKMDLHGSGVLVEQERLHMAMGMRPENFNFDKFRYMCILSGCDYLPSLPGIGLAKACKFITKVSDPDIHRALARLPLFLNMRQLPMTSEYRDEFLRADATFRYQLVYDPLTRSLLPLTSPPVDYKPADFAGKYLPPEIAYQLALGNLDPFSLKEMDTYEPEKSRTSEGGRTSAWEQKTIATHPSMWSKGYKIRPPAPPPDPRAIERPSTRGKEVNLGVARKSTSVVPPDLSPSDTDLASLYGDKSPSAKRPCLDTRLGYPPSPDKASSFPSASLIVAIEDNNIPTSPSPIKTLYDQETKPATPVVSSSITQNLPTKNVENSPKNILSLENHLSRSPIIGRKTRNPFSKKSTIKPKTLSFDTDEPKNKFSALAKFAQIRTSVDGQRKVHSRYFNKSEAMTSVAAPFEEPLHDISNIATLQARETMTANSAGEHNIVTTVVDPKTSNLSLDQSILTSVHKDMDIVCADESRDGKGNKGVDVASGVSTSVHKDMEIVWADESRDGKGNKGVDVASVVSTSVHKDTEIVWAAESTDERPSQRNAAQIFKWGSLHDRFGFCSESRPGVLRRTAAASRSFRPPPRDTAETDFYRRLAEEEEVDDPGVPVGSQGADSGVESVSSFSQDLSEPETPASWEGCSRGATHHGLLKTKTTRRIGLSKIVNMKRSDSQKNSQQSLLSMFGFQTKTSKFQYRQTL